ncbi:MULTISPECIES: NAD(P)H-hydrate dehydratase [unclassified Mucilaginibacter]|uniref:NAD(P)H-hydrate dehydratase n=1 Tax=unclassified Mucilaginibacter TaxID=2617802 RepID=UPI002AC8EECE|nr:MULTISPECIES: NAD(P)H-hydrate dehydratase [unclassified Mucilaginibacter]MEB0262248.1 NAD(P)H-hydrate dehydratase [Mucilaginibacter sp. 10I4]MEB0278637.1 NAD(P)H-hydrate dehydratase [Mucilaginibacter sp. 10B2]MEB0299347.1 NAD(P)H-hydrate dehydratase [Mucilaginibacter sp. 5C4]WPX23409.1 NAD(P)H-hydrate dehydratase [Mucilaginibacter sp. 5C4]
MLPLLVSKQIREADAYTIANEPISSVDLMERAGKAFVGWFINHFQDKKQTIAVYCGTGNNGGDGLAIARILCDHGYCNIDVKICRFSDKASDDFNVNFKRLKATKITIKELKNGSKTPLEQAEIIIDAMLGSGLNKPLAGDYKTLTDYLNSRGKTMVAVDVPTGFYADGEIPKDATVLKADLVITFQQPKLNFLLPESGPYINCCEVVKIGLDEDFINSVDTPYFLVEEKDAKQLIKPRHRFSNKGTYGHALIIAGKYETMGAALLSASACAHAGAGLTTACIPQSGLVALNSSMPEVMALVRSEIKLPEIEWDKFSTIGIGPGLGQEPSTLKLLKAIFKNYNKPVVIDADALNVLSENQSLLKKIPAGSIITPHMKEFDRLFGKHTNWWQRLQTAKAKAKELGIYIILKNDYTITATPDDKLYFNSTGNAAMATGGMGDVLTGIITSLLAQKYSPKDACTLGVYIHGKAGDELALPNRLNVVLPTKIITHLPVTMAKLKA